jgi:hypothetical protein
VLENHIIFCQKDISATTKIISDFLKSNLSVNTKNIHTNIVNVYSDGLLKKYINAILQKNRKDLSREKIKKSKNDASKLKKHFFYVTVYTIENKEINDFTVYPYINISVKEYTPIKQEILNILKIKNYKITNDRNNARYVLNVIIKDILTVTEP